jgi:hypothetical protein
MNASRGQAVYRAWLPHAELVRPPWEILPMISNMAKHPFAIFAVFATESEEVGSRGRPKRMLLLLVSLRRSFLQVLVRLLRILFGADGLRLHGLGILDDLLDHAQHATARGVLLIGL